jgi:3-methyladenine DNA glycosylase Tag
VAVQIIQNKQKLKSWMNIIVAVTKLHASRSQQNHATLQHEQWSPAKCTAQKNSVAKLATLYCWLGTARREGVKSLCGLEACNFVTTTVVYTFYTKCHQNSFTQTSDRQSSEQVEANMHAIWCCNCRRHRGTEFTAKLFVKQHQYVTQPS